MSRCMPLVLPLLCLSAFCLLARTGTAAPADAKVGDVRAIYEQQGTVIRKTPSALGGPVTTLPYGTKVKVLEKQKGWFRVQAIAGDRAEGWIQGWKTAELSALRPNEQPVHLKVTGSAGVSGKDVSAAGRQLTKDTERRYRTSRKDLAAAYRAVDAMEAATAALHPAEALAFIDRGNLGRRGRDYARPKRIAPSQARADQGSTGSRPKRRGPGGLLGRVGGEIAKRAGVDGKVAKGLEGVINAATQQFNQIKKAFTPEQEYFLGRAVAAQAIARFGVDKNDARRHYVRLVGEAVVRLTERLPDNIGGYHFEVLDSDEINGVSGPGGYVLITRGAVEACQSEAELAGILGHELAHIRYKDGEKMVRQDPKFAGFLKGLGGVIGAATGQEQISRGLTQFFGQVVDGMTRTTMNHGYSRALERRADTEGTYLLFDVFYEPDALRNYLVRMPADDDHGGGPETHDAPSVRAKLLEPVLAKLPFKAPAKILAPRQARFAERMGR